MGVNQSEDVEMGSWNQEVRRSRILARLCECLPKVANPGCWMKRALQSRSPTILIAIGGVSNWLVEILLWQGRGRGHRGLVKALQQVGGAGGCVY